MDNAGKLVCPGNGLLKLAYLSSNSIIGRCIGYQAYAIDMLVIDGSQASPEVKKYFYGASSLGINFYETYTNYNKTGPFYRFNDVNDIVVMPLKKNVINPYPNTCKICKAPSRKLGLLVLCSNTKCKSRGIVKKIYYNMAVPTPVHAQEDVDAEGYILCPECYERAYSSDSTGLWAMCRKNHRWVPRLEIGNQVNHPSHPYIWNGSCWQVK